MGKVSVGGKPGEGSELSVPNDGTKTFWQFGLRRRAQFMRVTSTGQSVSFGTTMLMCATLTPTFVTGNLYYLDVSDIANVSVSTWPRGWVSTTGVIWYNIMNYQTSSLANYSETYTLKIIEGVEPVFGITVSADANKFPDGGAGPQGDWYKKFDPFIN